LTESWNGPWTDRAAFAGKRDRPVESAIVAVKSREPARQPAALQKTSELLLDKARQSLSVAQTRRLRAKRLEVTIKDTYVPPPPCTESCGVAGNFVLRR
jgi:hypothetical protein